MDELARDMRISKKTIYKYFPSKGHLIKEISTSVINCVLDELNSVVEGEGNTIYKFIRITNLYQKNIIKIDNKWYRDLQMHAPEIWNQIEELRTENILYFMKRLLKQGKKEKLIEDFPNEIIITVIISAVRDVINPDFIIRNKFSIDQAADHTFNLLLNAILTPNGKEIYHKTRTQINNKIS
jgi:AcrR family transcriptional regulator